MSEFNITVPGGESKRLKTGGKYCPADIVVTAEGRLPVEEKDVNFYDYDGTLLYSYTLAEAQALTELPPAPTPPRDFLEFMEWNWTLEQIKTFGKVVDVGATYKTVDGTTRLIVDIWDNVVRTVTLCIKSWNAGTTIDWGDGAQTSVDSNVQTAAHEYASVGEYMITLTLGSGGWNLDLGDTSTRNVMNKTISYQDGVLREAYLGVNARCTPNAFLKCVALEAVTIPKSGITQIWSSAFKNCKRLKAAIIPSHMTKCVSLVFEQCDALVVNSIPFGFADCGYASFASQGAGRRIFPPNATVSGEHNSNCQSMQVYVEPEGLTAIPNMYLYQCFSLREYTVQETVTSIGASAFYNCAGFAVLRFLPTTPPTVANANAFTGIPTTCVVEVPAASLEAYKAATNYGSIAAQMVGV